MNQQPLRFIIAVALLGVIFTTGLHAQTTAFTYQGRFAENGEPFTGQAEFQFTLWDAATGGNQIAATDPEAIVASVTNGLFAASMDFGATAFDGTDRWLEIRARTSIGTFTLLTPRQPLSPTPYALRALTVSSGGLSGGTYDNAVTFDNPANTFTGDGAGLTELDASQLTGGAVPAAALANAWKASGNAGTTPGTHFLGTTDNQPLEFKVNGVRALRIEPNTNGAPNVIGGSPQNFVAAGVVGATIGGGGATLSSDLAFINKVTANFGTVTGGRRNTAGGNHSTAMGVGSIAGGSASTAMGGETTASGTYSTAMGILTTAGGTASTAMGFQTTASGSGSTAMGDSTTASGSRSTTTGYGTTAAGDFSTAMGFSAKANHRGSFVWADAQNEELSSTLDNQFRLRADGGVHLDLNESHFVEFRRRGSLIQPSRLIHTSTGAYLSEGGAWVNSSDRNKKENFRPVKPARVLEAVTRLPIATWNYKTEGTETRHLGPTAQDFQTAFRVGNDERAIATVDADGVALAAIQGLNEKLENRLQQKETEIAKIRRQNKEMKQELAELKAMVAELMHR